jgi:anti-anti-sigma regulatory factor
MILIGDTIAALPVPRAGATGLAAEGRPAGARLEVTVTQAAGEAVIRIEGEASYLAADFLEAALLGLHAQRPLFVRMDLSRLRCISCLAMGVLAGLSRGVVRAGGRVRLAPWPAPAVHGDLKRAGLLELMEGTEDKPTRATTPAGPGDPSGLSPA